MRGLLAPSLWQSSGRYPRPIGSSSPTPRKKHKRTSAAKRRALRARLYDEEGQRLPHRGAIARPSVTFARWLTAGAAVDRAPHQRGFHPERPSESSAPLAKG
jgi:hypothetical protein